MLWGQCWLQLDKKKSIESQARLMSWYWKWKPTWRKGLITYSSHPWIMFSFNWLVIIWRGGCSFEIGHTRSRGWKNFGPNWKIGVGGLENWTILIDVICVFYLSSLVKVIILIHRYHQLQTLQYEGYEVKSFFFFYLGFYSWTLTIYRTAG